MNVILRSLALLFTTVFLAQAELVNFDDAKVGELPKGWTGTNTGKGEAKWTIAAEDSAPSAPNVLKQSANADYPVAFKDDTKLQDGFVEVKYKAVSGAEDQVGGVVWRGTDANNYYLARANALEGNVRIYHFVKGKRTQFKSVRLDVAENQWHTLRVNFSANHFTVIFNGTELFSADDDTFKDAGQVGVWTKADSVTLFDNFSYGPK